MIPKFIKPVFMSVLSRLALANISNIFAKNIFRYRLTIIWTVVKQQFYNIINCPNNLSEAGKEHEKLKKQCNHYFIICRY